MVPSWFQLTYTLFGIKISLSSSGIARKNPEPRGKTFSSASKVLHIVLSASKYGHKIKFLSFLLRVNQRHLIVNYKIFLKTFDKRIKLHQCI